MSQYRLKYFNYLFFFFIKWNICCSRLVGLWWPNIRLWIWGSRVQVRACALCQWLILLISGKNWVTFKFVFKLLISLLTPSNDPRLYTSWGLPTVGSTLVWVWWSRLGPKWLHWGSVRVNLKSDWKKHHRETNSKHEIETLFTSLTFQLGVKASDFVHFGHQEVLLLGHGCCFYIQHEIPVSKHSKSCHSFTQAGMSAALACVAHSVQSFSPCSGSVCALFQWLMFRRSFDSGLDSR